MSSNSFNGLGMIENSVNQASDMWRFTMNGMAVVHDKM